MASLSTVRRMLLGPQASLGATYPGRLLIRFLYIYIIFLSCYAILCHMEAFKVIYPRYLEFQSPHKRIKAL